MTEYFCVCVCSHFSVSYPFKFDCGLGWWKQINETNNSCVCYLCYSYWPAQLSNTESILIKNNSCQYYNHHMTTQGNSLPFSISQLFLNWFSQWGWNVFLVLKVLLWSGLGSTYLTGLFLSTLVTLFPHQHPFHVEYLKALFLAQCCFHCKYGILFHCYADDTLIYPDNFGQLLLFFLKCALEETWNLRLNADWMETCCERWEKEMRERYCYWMTNWLTCVCFYLSKWTAGETSETKTVLLLQTYKN